MENIRAAIDNRNTIRKQNLIDPQLAPLNNNINKMIQEHKQQLWKEQLTTTEKTEATRTISGTQ